MRQNPVRLTTCFESCRPYTEATILTKGGIHTAADVWVAAIIHFIVDVFLLVGTSRLCGGRPAILRYLAAAAVGGVYSFVCLLPGFYFLGNPLWHSVCLMCLVLIAYGIKQSTWRLGAVFVLLSLALEGMALGFGNGSIFSIVMAAAGLCVLCVLGFRRRSLTNRYVPVEISRGDTHLQLTALQDTGNMLQDPVTGRPVLVIGAEQAQLLTGLSTEQLRRPVESIGSIPGLRLVPYRSVGTGNGLLLALNFQNVRIGKWQGSSLVAFSPEGLGEDYEALTGGFV